MFNCTILELQVSASADSSRRGGGSKHSHPHFCEYCLSRSSDLYPLECERLLSSIMPSGNAKATQIALLRSCVVCCNDTVVALEKARRAFHITTWHRRPVMVPSVWIRRLCCSLAVLGRQPEGGGAQVQAANTWSTKSSRSESRTIPVKAAATPKK